MLKNIILIRHGLVPANQDGLLGGHLDQSLSETGRQQLIDIDGSRFFPFHPAYELVSSPLKRAVESCEIIFPSITPKLEPRFTELNNGDFNSLTVAEVEKINPLFTRHAAIPDLSYPNGESLSGFFKRV